MREQWERRDCLGHETFFRFLASLEGWIAQAADQLLDLFACLIAQRFLPQELQQGRIVAAHLGALQGLLFHSGGINLLVIAEKLFSFDLLIRSWIAPAVLGFEQQCADLVKIQGNVGTPFGGDLDGQRRLLPNLRLTRGRKSIALVLQ